MLLKNFNLHDFYILQKFALYFILFKVYLKYYRYSIFVSYLTSKPQRGRFAFSIIHIDESSEFITSKILRQVLTFGRKNKRNKYFKSKHLRLPSNINVF